MLLQVEGLTKRYGKTTAVSDVSFSLERGELFSLLGPSGCGKSTILRMIGGFERADSGRVLLNGVDITALPPYRRDINTVFQNYALFPNMTVMQNVAYGLRIKRVPRSELRERVAEGIEMVGLRGLEERLPNQLSGGQQQRVAMARALVNRPALLLLDEPMSALDKKIAEQTRSELVALQKRIGITFVFVTHNQVEALAMSHRVAVMNRGRIDHCGAPREIYEHPATRFAADFIGAMNCFEGVLSARDEKSCRLELLGGFGATLYQQCPFEPGEKIQFLIRPERLKLSLLDPQDHENGVSGIVRDSVYLGETILHHIELPNGQTIAVNVPNYLTAVSDGFYEAGVPINVVWSQTSGTLIRAQ